MEEFLGLTGQRLRLFSAPGAAAGDAWPAAAIIQASRLRVLRVTDAQTQASELDAAIRPGMALQVGRVVLVADQSSSSSSQAPAEQEQQAALSLQCSSEQQAQQLAAALQQAAAGQPPQAQQQAQPGGGSSEGGNRFDSKTDKASADLYFHYYGMLQHQQNMLQDMTRTGTYHAAIVENRADFEGKVVMDVGAGSGILSLFAAQAGARKVLAVEASGMAQFARQLAEANPVGKVVQVCHSKVEELVLPDELAGRRVDVLVSEPMGTLLVNERMLESYIYARDTFLAPGGKMFPHLGRIHVAAFSDTLLHSELVAKALFWQQPAFYGINMTPLHQAAVDGYFAQVVVDAFDPSVLVSDCATRVFDFTTIKEEELHDISIPLNLTVAHPCTLHGVACWFDVLFNGSTSQRWLSTAPGLPTTHWFQLRCCLQAPLVVLSPNTRISGTLRLVAHARQSYDAHVELAAPPVSPGMPPQRSTGVFDLKEPYYRQLTTWQQQALAVPAAAALPAAAAVLAQQLPVAALAGLGAEAAGAAQQQQQEQQQQQQQQLGQQQPPAAGGVYWPAAAAQLPV